MPNMFAHVSACPTAGFQRSEQPAMVPGWPAAHMLALPTAHKSRILPKYSISVNWHLIVKGL
jgi:hypothetical protein